MKLLNSACFIKFSLIFVFLFQCFAHAQTADTVYLNGKIYTLNETKPWVQAIAIKDKKFIFVGSNEDVKKLQGSSTSVVDLKGKMLMPGIQDMHAHPMQAGETELFQCGFPFTLSVDEIVEKVKACAEKTPKGQWIRGGQWATELMESDTVPHKSILDAVTTEHPIYLSDSALHGAWLNSKAMEVLGINKDTQAPVGGVIVRDASGEPTGILQDNAAYDVLKRIPSYSDKQYQDALRWALKEMNKLGVVAVKDALVDRNALKAYKALDDNGQLSMRIASSLGWKASWTETPAQEKQNILERRRFRGTKLNTDFAKIFLDGIPPTRTAAMLEPYVPDEKYGPGFTGKLIHTPEQLKKDVSWLDAQGLTVKIHATGDRAARVALDAFEMARKKNGNSGHIHEVSHAEFIHPSDMPRFKQLNVAAEMCPIMWYPSSLVIAMAKVVGEKQANRFWPVKSLLEAGALLIYGSDWPSVVPDPNPWPGVESMVTRRDPYTNTGTQLWAEQAIELPEVLKIYTKNGALAMKTGELSGTIEVGKYADFIVLDRNLFEIPITEVSNTQVLRTVVEGQVVHDKL